MKMKLHNILALKLVIRKLFYDYPTAAKNFQKYVNTYALQSYITDL